MDELGFEGTPVGRVPEPITPAAPAYTGTPAPEPDGRVSGDFVAAPDALAVRMAQQVQRAHAAVVEAHRAISAWQVRHVAPPALHAAPREPAPEEAPPRATPPPAVPRQIPKRPAPPSQVRGGLDLGRTLSDLKAKWTTNATGNTRSSEPVAPPHAAAVTPSPADWSRLGGPAVIVRAAAARLREAGPLTSGHVEVTWHRLPPSGPVPLRTSYHPGGNADPAHCDVRDGDNRTLLTVSVGAASGGPVDRPDVPCHPREFKPPARTSVGRLSAGDLDALARGEVAAVLGSSFGQQHVAPELRPAPWPERLLEEVGEIAPSGGRWGQGLLTATTLPAGDGDAWPFLLGAVTEALRVYLFHRGIHLCLPGAHAVPLPGGTAHVELLGPFGGPLGLRAEVTRAGWIPRPFVTADAEVTSADGKVVARLRDVGVALYGRPELDPRLHIDDAGIRLTSGGSPAYSTELHMAHASEGDVAQLATASGKYDAALCPVRPRLPRGDFLMIDRGVEVTEGTASDRTGACGVTEYDMPPAPWYCRENGTRSVPALALMEISLQPAGLLSAIALGVALQHPDEPYVCRNLNGKATLLRNADPRGTTVTQRITVLSVTDLPGATLHSYRFELSTRGEVFYAGEALHGYLTQGVLDLQQGMDKGRCVPPWLDRQGATPAGLRRLDARGDARLGTGRLALLEDLVLVPGGGEHGAGYALCTKPVRPDDWYFDHHFFRDPVMPGSAGVQMLFQAVHAFALHTGLIDDLPDPELGLVAGEQLSWNYGAQILREHQQVRGEVHIRKATRKRDRLLIRADGSVWRDDLRIYQVRNIVLGSRPTDRKGGA
ncbi:3-hydroxyacyl-ACP dehydratase [Streptomyces blastmyceticus]|uniref:Trans-2-decenoyl-[acyl-carrier-protein] isomerase n=1 Tax=Streptomyces blastmyceticus TaxID=68180 RepID=A0ABP3GKD7_9ACTN